MRPLSRLPVSVRVPFLVLAAMVFATSLQVQTQSPSGTIDPSLIRIIDGGRGGVTVFGTGHYLTEPSASNPETIALDYVRAHLADFGLTDREGEELYVVNSHATPHDGVARVVLGQRAGGIRIHTAQLVATIDREGRLVMVAGRTAVVSTSGYPALSAGEPGITDSTYGGVLNTGFGTSRMP